MPCGFKNRLESMAVGPHKNWIVAKCGNEDTYHFYVETVYLMWPWSYYRTFIAGPHWTAYCEAYAIEEDDVVTFTYNEKDHLFSLEVTDANNAIKPWVHNSGLLVTVVFLNYTLSSLLFASLTPSSL